MELQAWLTFFVFVLLEDQRECKAVDTWRDKLHIAARPTNGFSTHTRDFLHCRKSDCSQQFTKSVIPARFFVEEARTEETSISIKKSGPETVSTTGERRTSGVLLATNPSFKAH